MYPNEKTPKTGDFETREFQVCKKLRVFMGKGVFQKMTHPMGWTQKKGECNGCSHVNFGIFRNVGSRSFKPKKRARG